MRVRSSGLGGGPAGGPRRSRAAREAVAAAQCPLLGDTGQRGGPGVFVPGLGRAPDVQEQRADRPLPRFFIW